MQPSKKQLLLVILGAFSSLYANASTVTYTLDLTVTSYTGPDPFGFTSAQQASGSFTVSFDSSALVPSGTQNPPIVPMLVNGQIGLATFGMSCYTSGATGPCAIATDSTGNFSGLSFLENTPVQPMQCDPVTQACRQVSVGIHQNGTWSASDWYGTSGSYGYVSDGTLSGTYTIVPTSAAPLPASAWLMLSGLTGLGLVTRRRKLT